MTWKLPTGQAVFKALALMARREAKAPRRAQRRVSHMEQQARAVAGSRRRKARLQKEAATQVAARLKSERASRGRRPQGTLIGGIMATMEPGKWYGARDIAELSGLGLKTKDVRATLLQGPMRRGLVERALNPAWRPRGSGPGSVGNPQQMMANPEVEPMWLYRITPAGEEAQKKTGA